MKAELSDYPYFDHRTPLAFAHRGGAKLPGMEQFENTAIAFQAALDLGYRYLETDVHASADRVVYAFHDADLTRLGGSQAQISELDSAQIDRVRIGGSEPIPRLSSLLEQFPQARFNIDVKADSALEPTLELLTQRDALDRICLASFSGRRLATMRRMLKRAATCAGPLEVAALRLGPTRRIREHAVRGGALCLQVPLRHYGVRLVTPKFVQHAHNLGMQVHVWTIDDAETMRSLLRIGVDGIVTDRPDLLKAVLKSEGAWTFDD